MAGYKPEYTRAEDKDIVLYIIQRKAQYLLRGNAIWKEMESSGEFERSWQSLKERFRKKIYPNLHILDLDKEDLESIRLGYAETQKAPAISKKREHNVCTKKEFMFTVSDTDSE